MLPKPSDSVVCEPVSDGAVLLDMRSETYFGLNRVGRDVWGLLPPECEDLAALCVRLGARYPDVPPETLAADVQDLLSELLAHGLVTASPARDMTASPARDLAGAV